MSKNVRFNEEEFHLKSRTVLGKSRKPKMVDWLEKKGVVKSERSAQLLLILVIVVCFALSGFILVSQFGDSQDNNLQTVVEGETF